MVRMVETIKSSWLVGGFIHLISRGHRLKIRRCPRTFVLPIKDVLKSEFEAAFKEYDSGATFNYLKSFRRARVNFSTTEATVQARLGLNDKVVCGQPIKCYFAQVPKSTDDHLHPPKPEKMFLISPPCSPPVGWEQHREAEPVLNFELIQALSNLSPGESHEVHPASESQPGIVVHVCEDPEGYGERPNIVQTHCPEHN